MSEILVNFGLLVLLVISALAINQQRNLFAAVMITGIYSLLCASLFVCLDAVDVAFTEAAVGAGIATILFLGTLAMTSSREPERVSVSWPGLVLVVFIGSMLIFGVSDIPAFGQASNPVQTYLGETYIDKSAVEIGVPNLVTSVLSSYRGYDTLGETVVIFTAGVAVLMLLGRGKHENKSMTNKVE
ncbi:MAG: DUF4040 domain-containing protein [Gammaproteobacteria bacterium]